MYLCFLNLQNKASCDEFSAREEDLQKRVAMLEEALREHEKPMPSLEAMKLPEKDKPSLSQSLKLNKKDCMLELQIDQAVFDSAAYDNQKSFVSWMMPFTVDDPLQHTDLAIGSIASYRHTSLYRIPSKALNNLEGSIASKNKNNFFIEQISLVLHMYTTHDFAAQTFLINSAFGHVE